MTTPIVTSFSAGASVTHGASVEPTPVDERLSIVTMAQGVLDGVVAVYAQQGVDLPGRRYWTLSTPAADCEQLVVYVMQAYMGPPGDEAATPQRCDGPKTAVLSVQVIRCVPTMSTKGRAPLAEDIQSASERLAVDMWLLLDSAESLDQWDPLGGPGLGIIATVEAGEPQGGFQGVTLQITMAIP